MNGWGLVHLDLENPRCDLRAVLRAGDGRPTTGQKDSGATHLGLGSLRGGRRGATILALGGLEGNDVRFLSASRVSFRGERRGSPM